MAIGRRHFLLNTAALAALAAAPRRAAAQEGSASQAELDAVLLAAVERGDVPGVAAIAAGRNGVLYEGAFGERVLGGSAPMTLDTVMLIASMTKPITATAAMQLVEQGQLDLDAPAARYVPEIGEVQVLDGWDAAGKPRLRAPAREITLRHLMTHTAGFGYGLWDAEVARYNEAEAIPSVLSGDPRALQSALMFDPGERWEYGISVDWVAKIVEAVSGQSLGAYMQAQILDPLGMASTGYRITPDMRSRLAKVHQREEDGSFTPTDLERQQDPVVEMGGGGLYSTASDYIRFVRMVLNEGALDGNRVLEAETVAQMSRNAMGEVRVAALATQSPGFSADLEMFPAIAKSWGLSFMINENAAPTGRAAGSPAWAGITNTYFWIDPATGIGGVYFTQSLPFLDPRVLASYLAFETAVYGGLT